MKEQKIEMEKQTGRRRFEGWKNERMKERKRERKKKRKKERNKVIRNKERKYIWVDQSG